MPYEFASRPYTHFLLKGSAFSQETEAKAKGKGRIEKTEGSLNPQPKTLNHSGRVHQRIESTLRCAPVDSILWWLGRIVFGSLVVGINKNPRLCLHVKIEIRQLARHLIIRRPNPNTIRIPTNRNGFRLFVRAKHYKYLWLLFAILICLTPLMFDKIRPLLSG